MEIEKISTKAGEYFSGKPVLKAYLFGSYARSGTSENSDIDILVELGHSEPTATRI